MLYYIMSYSVLCNLRLNLLMAINVLLALAIKDAQCLLLKILKASLLMLMRIFLTLLILNRFSNISFYQLNLMNLHRIIFKNLTFS